MNTTTLEQPRTGTWDGGNEPFKASYGKLMMWFFLLSDAFTFAAFLTTYGLIRHRHLAYTGTSEAFKFSVEYWPIPEKVFNGFPGLHGMDLPLAFVALMTMILILSSVTMVLAVEAGHRMDKNDVQKWLLWTILFGSCFIGSQAWEWTHFISGADIGSAVAENTTFFGANLVQNQYGPPLFADLFFFYYRVPRYPRIFRYHSFDHDLYKYRKRNLRASRPLRNGRESWFILALCRPGLGIRIYLLLPGLIKIGI